MQGKIVQLDMFLRERDQQKEAEEKEFRSAVSRSMKALFARHNEIEYVVFEMHERLEELREALIKNG